MSVAAQQHDEETTADEDLLDMARQPPRRFRAPFKGSLTASSVVMLPAPEHTSRSSDGPAPDLVSIVNATTWVYATDTSGKTMPTLNLYKTLIQIKPLMRFQYALVIMHWSSGIVFMTLPFVHSPSIQSILVGVHAALALPALLFAFCGCCTRDMVRLLVCDTFEWWFLTIFNTMHWSAIAVAFHDVRAISCGVLWLTNQQLLFQDADVLEFTTRTLYLPLVCSVLLVFTMIVALIPVVPWSAYRLPITTTRSLSLVDAVIHAGINLVVFYVRHWLARHPNRRQQKPPEVTSTSSAVVASIVGHGDFTMRYCALYRVHLVLRNVFMNEMENPSLYISQQFHSRTANKQLIAQGRRRSSAVANLQPLRRANQILIQHLNTHTTVLSCIRSPGSTPLHPLKALVLYLVGILSFVALVYGTFLAQFGLIPWQQENQLVVLEVAALVGTLLFCGCFVLSYQRDLFRVLWTSFDPVFSCCQCGIAMICLCDMLAWDRRCVCVVAWAVWFHWLLFLDAVTPSSRKFVRFKKLAATPVVLTFLYGLLGIFGMLYIANDTSVGNTVLWTHGATETIVLSTESMLVGRILTMLLWNCQLIDAIGIRPEPELSCIRDFTEYVVPDEVLRLMTGSSKIAAPSMSVSRRISPTAVLPTDPPSATS